MNNHEAVGLSPMTLPALLGEKPCNRIYFRVIDYPITTESGKEAKYYGCLGNKDEEGNEVLYRETGRNFQLNLASFRKLHSSVKADRDQVKNNQIIPVFDDQFTHDDTVD